MAQIEDITLEDRESDDAIAMFIKTKRGEIKSYVLSKELLVHLRDSAKKRIAS